MSLVSAVFLVNRTETSYVSVVRRTVVEVTEYSTVVPVTFTEDEEGVL